MKALCDAGYMPVYQDKEEKQWQSYVCKRDGTLCRVLLINDLELSRELVPFMSVQNCSDFITQFYKYGRYFIVYAHNEGNTLSKALNEKRTITGLERTTIVRNIMKEFITKRVDTEYAEYILRIENIVLYEDNKASFLYAPPKVGSSRQNVCALLAEVILRILDKGLSEEGLLWLDKLKKRRFNSICEAYFKMPKELFEDVSEDKDKNEKEIGVKEKDDSKDMVIAEGYWDCRWFYLKKRPILLVFSIAVIIFTLMQTVLPYIKSEGG